MKYKIAFVCVHNSCRSQMAEAICNKKYNEYFTAYSAGTHTKENINQDIVPVLKALYDIDIDENVKPKLLTDIPSIDIVVTMGCNVDCPTVNSKYRFDFNLMDPSGSEAIVYELTAKLIDEKINNLVSLIKLNEITL